MTTANRGPTWHPPYRKGYQPMLELGTPEQYWNKYKDYLIDRIYYRGRISKKKYHEWLHQSVLVYLLKLKIHEQQTIQLDTGRYTQIELF